MIDLKFYICKYCFKEFEPKRRRVQKFCSNTCRSKAHHAKKSSGYTKTKTDSLSVPNNLPSATKEKMSATGIGNAAVGSLAADALKSLLTSEQNKPATKGDLTLLLEKLNSRYHLITNMAPNALGHYPYFDIDTGHIVYLKPSLK